MKTSKKLIITCSLAMIPQPGFAGLSPRCFRMVEVVSFTPKHVTVKSRGVTWKVQRSGPHTDMLPGAVVLARVPAGSESRLCGKRK
jgi:hypothetical protein